VTGRDEDKQQILEETKKIVSQVPMPTEVYGNLLQLQGVLMDVALTKKMVEIIKKAIQSDSSYKTVTLESPEPAIAK
jgi:hypothetical protein